MSHWPKLVALAALAAGATAPAHAQSSCDRACLTGYVDAYYAALFANDASKLRQAARARITDNGAEKKLAETFWDGAAEAVYRFDIVNTDRGDTGTQTVIRNADGSKTMHMVRLKVQAGAITEIETIRANRGDRLTEVSPDLTQSIRVAERDSYYDLIGTAESYWRAFQTNGTPEYRPARLLPDARRFENGLQTTSARRRVLRRQARLHSGNPGRAVQPSRRAADGLAAGHGSRPRLAALALRASGRGSPRFAPAGTARRATARTAPRT